jgi:hypothetical protein
MDENDKRKLRPNNGMSALFLYRKEIVGWIVVGKAESILSEDDDFSSKLIVLICGIVCYLSGVYWICS